MVDQVIQGDNNRKRLRVLEFNTSRVQKTALVEDVKILDDAEELSQWRAFGRSGEAEITTYGRRQGSTTGYRTAHSGRLC